MHDPDLGLAHDLQEMRRIDAAQRRPRAIGRRQALREAMGWMAGAALVPLLPSLACEGDATTRIADGETTDSETTSETVDTSSETSPETVTSCEPIPEETAGPYPGDGSNGPNVLTLTDIVRKDIRSSIGSLTGTAAGVPLTIRLQLVDTNNNCASLAGMAVYLWHCDQGGNYSLYTVTNQNYLRGVQVSDSDGVVEFTSIFPACYSGRWPHIHFEVYPDLASTSSSDNAIHTSQLALPKSACDVVFATSGYEDSVGNLQQVSLSSDNVFRDDSGVLQIGATIGSVAAGYTTTLVVGVDG